MALVEKDTAGTYFEEYQAAFQSAIEVHPYYQELTTTQYVGAVTLEAVQKAYR